MSGGSGVDSLTGSIIGGKYRVDGVLGEGGMGVVLSAVHLELERRVAIKVIRPDLSAEDGVAKRMLLEARHASSIGNEHVARVLDLGRLDSGAPYIVMEYLEGRSLFELVQARGPLAPLEAVDYVMEACEAVAEAHSRGIIHRDLKPENLFLATRADGTPTIKVLDFGVSKSSAANTLALTNPSTAVGSPFYMAPEQMRARSDVDGRADVYALGAILFELLTGRPPFEADNIPTLCTLVLNSEPPTARSLNGEIPAGLDEVIQRCLKKKPDDRFWSIAELAKALLPFGSDAARTSVERATRVLGDQPPPKSMRVPPMHEARMAPTLELESIPEVELQVSATPTAPTLSASRKRWWAVILVAALLGLGAVVVLVFASQSRVDAELGRAAGAVSSAAHRVKVRPPPEPARVEVAPVTTPLAETSSGPAPAAKPPARPPVAKHPHPAASGVPLGFGGRK